MNNVTFIITNLLIGCSVVALGFLRWRRTSPDGKQWSLQYPWLMKILAAVGMMLVCTGVSTAVDLTSGYAKLLVALLALPALGMAFMAAAEVFVAETSYDESALYRCTPWKQSMAVRFDKVARIENSILKPHFVVYSQDGQAIRVTKWIAGSEEVLGYAQEGLESNSAAVNVQG